MLTLIARRRGLILPGNEPDFERCGRMLLDELRGGKLGRVTLEMPNDKSDEELV
jgi:ribosome biogenesis GTPase A